MSSTVLLTPSLGAKGSFTAEAPFVVDSTIVLEVIAVRSFMDMVNAGDDPIALVYAPHGLGTAAYSADLVAGACVVVLASATTAPIYIPSSYLLNAPVTDVIPYVTLIGSFMIGPYPASADLIGVCEDINSYLKATLGIADANVELSAIPTSEIVTASQDQALTAARESSITDSTSLVAKLRDARIELASLQARYTSLVSYVSTLNRPSSGS